ncbi:terminase small subunit [Mycobacterium phage UnionJack]|uniref:Terminase small subunit n=1 Tax=Mycobacterium phage UnionJack TaxID=1673876 RepID=A0A0K1LJL6_9CAUD|nr:terminase small subunit [Mycobacterium phage UnionJack]AKU42355.1 terminase small subunit [Mycobacterium phage UnionJack]
MGAATRGPVPERTDQTVRHSEPVDKIEVFGEVKVPALGDISYRGETHPIIQDLYQAMQDSGQSKFYEPSDWQVARLTLLALNEELIAARHQNKPIGAMKLTALNQMLTALMLTEGDRRRVRIELERKPSQPEGVVINAADQFKKWLEEP